MPIRYTFDTMYAIYGYVQVCIITMNGQQCSAQNLATFLSWVASKTDADYREMVVRGQLNRREIARECGFAKSVLLQNPRVRDSLKTLETELRERDLTPDLLPHLELAYAITIHKAQGSQFPRAIVPVRHSRLLDRTMLYTAITRAQKQVILVGDVAAAAAAVEAPPHASLRQVALGSMLNEILERMA